MKTEDIQRMLLDLNPSIFDGTLAPEDYKIRLVGEFTEGRNSEGKAVKLRNFFLTPSRRPEGMPEGNYMTAEITPLEQLKTSTTTDKAGKPLMITSFRGLTKAKVVNIFETSQNEVYNYLAEAVGTPSDNGWVPKDKAAFEADGLWPFMLTNSNGNPTVGLPKAISGKWITVNCPAYHPQVIDANGVARPLIANHIDRKTGEYAKRPAVNSSFSFFVFEVEMDNILARAMKEYSRSVAGNEVEVVTITTEKAGDVTVTTKAPLDTQDEAAETTAKKNEEKITLTEE